MGVVEQPHRPPDIDRLFVPEATVVWASVGSEPLDITEHEVRVADDTAGAVVSFVGTVRNHDGGRLVSRLEYHAHPSAAEVLAQIAADVARSTSERCRLAVSHRVGQLEIGDVALACAVSAAHRGTAFAVCAELVEAVKMRLPIWKLQVFSDGAEEWVGSSDAPGSRAQVGGAR